MSKKNNKNKSSLARHKNRKPYNKNKFVENVCKQCGLCSFSGQKKIKPYCFYNFYLRDKELFLKEVLPILIRVNKTISEYDYEIWTREEYILDNIETIFETCFCGTGACGSTYYANMSKEKSCPYLYDCVDDFLSKVVIIKKPTKPSYRFFCNTDFLEEINLIFDETKDNEKNIEGNT